MWFFSDSYGRSRTSLVTKLILFAFYKIFLVFPDSFLKIQLFSNFKKSNINSIPVQLLQNNNKIPTILEQLKLYFSLTIFIITEKFAFEISIRAEFFVIFFFSFVTYITWIARMMFSIKRNYIGSVTYMYVGGRKHENWSEWC